MRALCSLLLPIGLFIGAAAQADTIRLSDRLDAVRAALSAPADGGSHALVIDAARLDRADAAKILKSLQTLRRADSSSLPAGSSSAAPRVVATTF